VALRAAVRFTDSRSGPRVNERLAIVTAIDALKPSRSPPNLVE